MILLKLMLCAVLAAAAQPSTGQWKSAPLAAVQTAAKGGDAKAALELGLRYDLGRGGAGKDQDEAIKWLRKAADAGDTDAQVIAGMKLAYGNGPNSDQVDAFNYFKQAAAQGTAVALYELGVAYKTARGTVKNDAEAVAAFSKAAEAGHAGAQFELGDCMESGSGVAVNLPGALENFRRAADQNNPAAQRRLGQMYVGGKGVAKDAREGMKWLIKAANAGDSQAQWELVKAYQASGAEGKEKATPWLRKLAEQKDGAAQAQLATSAPEQLKKIAKPLTFNTRGGGVDESLVNSVVLAEGRLVVPTGNAAAGTPPPRQPRVVTQPPQRSQVSARGAAGSATPQAYMMVVTSKGSDYKVSLDVSQIANFKATPDMHVRVYGTLTGDKIVKGLLADLTPPAFEWRYKLIPPGTIVAGRSQTYVVEGAVKNTGKQPLRNIKVKVRMYQTSSPNDESTTLDIKALNPGEVQPFRVSVEMFNYQYLGATSTPKVEMEVTDYEY